MLLHTLPYYLAITRSSCEVVCLFCLSLLLFFTEANYQLVTYLTNGFVFPIIRINKNTCIKRLPFQVHVLSLRIGNKTSNVSGKAVKLGGYQWKDEQPNVRKWKLWVIFHLRPSNSCFVSMKYIGLILDEKGCPCSADGCDYLLLDCTYNCSLRWRLFFLYFKSKNI